MTESFSLNQYIEALCPDDICPDCGASVELIGICAEGYIIYHRDRTQATCIVPWSAHPFHVDISDLQEGTDANRTE